MRRPSQDPLEVGRAVLRGRAQTPPVPWKVLQAELGYQRTRLYQLAREAREIEGTMDPHAMDDDAAAAPELARPDSHRASSGVAAGAKDVHEHMNGGRAATDPQNMEP